MTSLFFLRLGVHIPPSPHYSFEGDGWTAEVTYYRRGFEDCAEVVEELVFEAKDLDQAKDNVKRVLATVKEKKIAEIRAELEL